MVGCADLGAVAEALAGGQAAVAPLLPTRHSVETVARLRKGEVLSFTRAAERRNCIVGAVPTECVAVIARRL
jgi:hypothetical protein